MTEKVFFLFIAGIVSFTLIQIITDQIKRKRIRDKIILKLNRNYSQLLLGLIWLAFFLIWSFLLITEAQELYHSLGSTYINSVYQVLDLGYLQSLRSYFYENSMLRELNNIASYQHQLPSKLVWVFGSACLSILYFYKGCRHIEFIDNGIFLSGQIIRWDEIINFKWSSEKKPLGKNDRYYDLLLTLKKSKLIAFFGVHNQLEIKVNMKNKDIVNSLLESHINII
ncbi:hypothetical protein SAMN05660649_04216 [Desulfotomaculum arcticum]|uniref:DUF5673 domain-containing protein n=1 Tax=Desulfotruncus arcticus DSM 17038 TaxID=1121424 RepID=A0A1I2XZR5_9FIRM|nr:hypothetical protein [Desulfotruncus arcticus]SFH18980.1 hypothetical protein SAMN05660649_04216 [Desulfotomaculum arcticum] [Desulfotruncus arcticus DSM 17038]